MPLPGVLFSLPRLEQQVDQQRAAAVRHPGAVDRGQLEQDLQDPPAPRRNWITQAPPPAAAGPKFITRSLANAVPALLRLSRDRLERPGAVGYDLYFNRATLPVDIATSGEAWPGALAEGVHIGQVVTLADQLRPTW